jgi:hypothetical protein
VGCFLVENTSLWSLSKSFACPLHLHSININHLYKGLALTVEIYHKVLDLLLPGASQASPSVLVLRKKIGTFLYQQFDQSDIPLFTSDMEWGTSIVIT